MDVRFSFEGRTERLIATGRAILASFSLLAIYLDPSEPSRYAGLAYLLLTAYVVYALIILLLVWFTFAQLIQLRLITHVLDLGIFSAFMYFTEGSTSPFFVYFIFSILCGTLRWHWRGTLWTTVAALSAFLAMGFYAGEILGDPSFELNRFIIRTVYLGIVAAFVGYLAVYESQHRSQLARLAAWPRIPSVDLEDVLKQVLEHAGKMLGATRVLMAWEETEEPWLYLAILAEGQLQRSRKPVASFGPLVRSSLEGKSFFCKDAQNLWDIVVVTASSDSRQWKETPVNEELQKLFDIRSVLSTTVSGENFRGRLFFLDKADFNSDSLIVAEVVAGHTAASRDLFYFLQRVQELVTMEERIRLSRDLHDGVLQSLAVAGLRLRGAVDLLKTAPETAVEQLRGVQDIIVQEQRDLRSVVESLRRAPFNAGEIKFELAYWLEHLRKAIERQWNLRVELKNGSVGENIPTTLAREIYYIVREGLVNAARHSHASLARVELQADNHQVYINVSDDGGGFPFRGKYDYATLLSRGLGPSTLKSRIASLGGLLNIDSSATGARLQIILPLSQLSSFFSMRQNRLNK